MSAARASSDHRPATNQHRIATHAGQNIQLFAIDCEVGLEMKVVVTNNVLHSSVDSKVFIYQRANEYRSSSNNSLTFWLVIDIIFA